MLFVPANPVASFAEAWIEMVLAERAHYHHSVASFAEAWIEIFSFLTAYAAILSPPSRRRGLKYVFVKYIQQMLKGRLLRGGVD